LKPATPHPDAPPPKPVSLPPGYDPEVEQFPKLPARRRLLIALLAVATAVVVVMTMLHPPGGVQRKRPPPPPDVAVCAPGQTQHCVGGTATVIVAPASR